ncbi:MAG TPA: hydrogenase maturation protease [Pyrinomonadaceae bacterium]|nr:hydrogenase maturation protease [Pyrinomonadaceae bacterium]
MTSRVLVAGIGNIFMGDDAFGCEVIRRLAGFQFPENVRIFDFGIRGFDLAYALMEGYDLTILVDAVPRGEPAGTVYTIEPDLRQLEQPDQANLVVETHGMNPMKVLQLVNSMGGTFKKILLVGCEPESFGPEEGQMGLSPSVAASVDRAVQVINDLISEFLGNPALWEANKNGQEQWVSERV